VVRVSTDNKTSSMIPLTRRFLLACVLAVLTLPVLAGDLPPLSHLVAGGDSEYRVQPGDFLIAIGARFGVAAKVLAQANHIRYAAIIRPGQQLHIHNPHIVPAGFDNGILINIPQRMLFDFRQGELTAAYPVGLGKPTWPTPDGKFKIVTRETNKTWKVPKSIQEEMRREQKIVQEEVPPGPDNPLGAYWLGLNLWGYGIHGTIAPSSVFHFQSHGCIRLHPDDVADLFQRVKVGTPGAIIYQPALLAVVNDGRILLEVHRDIYEKGTDAAQTVRDLAQTNGLNQAIDWPAVAAVIAAQDGLAREVGRLQRGETKGEP
jgi:L,D-transpeptidase ErfK/SrfK